MAIWSVTTGTVLMMTAVATWALSMLAIYAKAQNWDSLTCAHLPVGMGLTHGSIAPPDVMTATIFQGMVALASAMLRKDSTRLMGPQRFRRFVETESIMDI